MNKVSHTPGPWSIETPMGDEVPWIVEADKPTHEWHCIAMVPCNGDEDEDALPLAEAEANLRLIASAPELYRAVKLLLSAVDHLAGTFGQGWQSQDASAEGQDAYDFGEQALAKVDHSMAKK